MPLAIWILTGYFRSIPHSLEDAAKIDGCGPIILLIKVFLPVAAPGLVAVVILSFTLSWSDFLLVNILAMEDAVKPITVILAGFVAETENPEITVVASSAIVGLAPVLILILIFQKFIIKGLTTGAEK